MNQSHTSILIIDDQAAIREIVADMVHEFELAEEIEAVRSLNEARVAIGRQPWHAIISDMSLADGNALDLFESLQQQGVSLPPILLMSGFLFDTMHEKADRLGIRHILNKPFLPNDLLDMVQQLLSAQSQPDA